MMSTTFVGLEGETLRVVGIAVIEDGVNEVLGWLQPDDSEYPDAKRALGELENEFGDALTEEGK